MEHLTLETISQLANELKGEVYSSETMRRLYSTDASAYREMPEAVVLPKDKEEIRRIIQFANENKVSLIPRTAGTSLAGQVVGKGIVVDTSKYMTAILELNIGEKWVKVQPGVVLDELNKYLQSHGLFFGPETSTSNRCMMGGMVGNNSCGAHSILYGSTRDHTLELECFLSDGSEVVFGEITTDEFNRKCDQQDLEGTIYRHLRDSLSAADVQEEIRKEYPDPSLERRNTGYAIDVLIGLQPFNPDGDKFNMCRLICGSEGTLSFITSIKLNLVDLPPKQKALLVVHHKTLEESFDANLIALEHKPGAIELMDDYILDCTKSSMEHKHNRFFIEGDPAALLCVEFARHTKEELDECTSKLIADLKSKNMGYHYPVVYGADISRVWALRKAGLGMLSNIPGDAKPQPVIEDTAVAPKYLPQYLNEFRESLAKQHLTCVFYAHIATGELHLRPVLDLKTAEGVLQFRQVATDISRLVKKYKGSLSGEHGDGRLRGEFIEYMVGPKNYSILKAIKNTWDPNGVFNPGKIVDTPPMDSNLRYQHQNPNAEPKTIFSFDESLGFVRMAEKCNGSGDCRKSHIIGGTMCPTFQATKDEDKTTRARANMLREIFNRPTELNPYDSQELYDILDLCIACKGCKRECPSGVDMAKLKSEFLYQYYKTHSVSLRVKLISAYSKIQTLAIPFSGIYNALQNWQPTGSLIKRMLGFSQKRKLPKLNRISLYAWARHFLKKHPLGNANGRSLYLFVDEFTNYTDLEVGMDTVKLLHGLGYQVLIAKNKESGRVFISKGQLAKAQKIAKAQMELFKGKLSDEVPLVGIEPSAILTFRDEYPDLLRDEEAKEAQQLAGFTFTIEEFFNREFQAGRITKEHFTEMEHEVIYHGHCQQKALTGTKASIDMLSIPQNYTVKEIASGCCGMAGSFGYEKEHYDLSLKIAEMVLLPTVRLATPSTLVSASGTSCRHQIEHGTGREALHPVQILYRALK